MRCDIVVIGGGPAGLIAAQEAASRHCEVVVLEEHHTIGEPDHCAGLLSITGLKRLGLSPEPDVIQHRVSGARIYAPSCESILIERGHREAVVVDRRRFDRWLADRATDSGVRIETDTPVQRLLLDGRSVTGIVLRHSRQELTSQVVIDAEGFRCLLSRTVGLPPVLPEARLPAYQYEMANADVDEDVVEMFYGRSLAPGFFAWIIPLGDRRARVGMASTDRTRERLQAAIRHHRVMRKRLANARVERSLGGVVLVGMPIKKTYTAGMMVVGDAAGMVKPTTGGGVVFGGIAARIAGQVAAHASIEHDSSENILREYQYRWRTQLMRELRIMHLVQRILTSLPDKGLDSLISDIARFGLIETIRREGDMDMQGRVIVNLLRRPSSVIAVSASLFRPHNLVLTLTNLLRIACRRHRQCNL